MPTKSAGLSRTSFTKIDSEKNKMKIRQALGFFSRPLHCYSRLLRYTF